MLRKSISHAILAAALGAGLLPHGGLPEAEACTGIFLKAGDGSYVHARTLEFAIDLDSEVLVIPRGYQRTGSTPDGRPGMKWQAKYASVGANGLDLPMIFDGLNEKGLAIGLFYFPDFAGYMPYQPGDAQRTIAPWELGSWILDNFASVEEVRAGLDRALVADVAYQGWGFAPEVHYVVQDASGGSIVVEYIDGKLHVHDNPLGVITNSPSFDWHMTNLRNYVNFSLTNVPPVHLGPVTLQPLGQGSGMLGLPGDFTPPSRFVRAAAFSQSVLPSATGEEAVLQAFHILNNFDIPRGSTRDEKKDAHGNILADYTFWTSANDLKARRFYFRTYDNSRIRMVDLGQMELDAPEIVRFSMKGKEAIEVLKP